MPCSDCKFWERLSYMDDGEVPDRPFDARDANPIEAEPGFNWGLCVRERSSQPLMVSCDASLYESSIYTRQDFGCIQHEEAS